MVTTIVSLRARKYLQEPVAGMWIKSPAGEAVYRVLNVIPVVTAGDQGHRRHRLVCEKHRAADVPSDVIPNPWTWTTTPPRRRRRRETADPGPPEDPRARIERIRAKAPLLLAEMEAAIRRSRAADQAAQLARARRVGRDDGVRHGRDLGPGIRLHAVKTRTAGTLRLADVSLEDGADPGRPNHTVRRARRVDPLLALRRAGSITDRHYDAIERLREAMEAATPSMPSLNIVRVPGHGGGIPIGHVEAQTDVRTALAAISRRDREPVLWVSCGGSISGYAEYARVRHVTASERLRDGAARLADHYYGPEN